MAAVITELGTRVFNTTSGTHTETATPAVGDLIILIVANSGSVASVPPTDNNSDGLGTYSRVASAVKGTNADLMEFWVRNALIGSASSTIYTQAPGTTTGGGLGVLKVTGMTLAGLAAIRQIAKQDNQAASGTPTPVFDVAPLTTNAIIGAVFNGTSPATMTPRTSFTEIFDVGYSTPTTGIEVMSRNSGETATSQAWGGTSASAFCSIVIELDISAAQSSPRMMQSKQVSVSGEVDATISLGKLPTVGNYIVVTATTSGPSGPEGTPTDNQSGNTYTAIGAAKTTAGGERIQAYIAKVVNSSGTFTITIPRATPGGGGWGANCAAFEYSDVDSVTPVDQNTGAGPTSSAAPNSGNITPSRANTLIFGLEADDTGSDTALIVPGTNFVTRETQLVISTQNRFSTEDKVSLNTTAVAANFVLPGSASWVVKVFNLNPPFTVTTTKTQTGLSRITVSTTQTILGKARLTVTTVQTILGKARMQQIVNKLQQGLSRITASTTKTQTGKARITITTTQTIQGLARITITTTRTILGKASINNNATATKTIQGLARITATTLQTILGKSRITATTTQTQTGKSRIQKITNATQQGVARITALTTKTIQGIANIRNTTVQTQTGKARITTTVVKLQLGEARITISTPRTQLGKARVTATTNKTQLGVAHIQPPQDYSRESIGSLPTDTSELSTVYNATEISHVATQDGVYVDATGQQKYILHEFKNAHINNIDDITVTWIGKSTRPCSDFPVKLQIYNFNSSAWEDLDSNSTTGANIDITLFGAIGVSPSHYYDSNYYVNCRVYQEVI